ncbi:MAG: 4Fe-4S binding protein [Desulfobacteraceae bacterium]|nr:4Fe-4S binding protein [Desulfobacteraceae bacterium]
MDKEREEEKAAETPEAGSKKQSVETGSGEAKTPAGKKKQFEIDIFRAWCKSCGICAAFCPRECIGLDEEGSPFAEDSSRCTGCGWCELHCPDFAISVREKDSERPVN